MSFTLRTWYLACLATALAVLLPATAPAKAPSDQSEGNTVELFSAMDKGQLDVKVIPKNATQVRVLITNKTKVPLNVKLPKAIAAVPVLAQAAGGGGGGGGRSRSSNSANQQQALGGGMMGGGGMAGGGGMFSIPAEKVGQLKATTVCLEYGKPEPHPTTAYTIKPIEQYTDKPELQELCQLVGTSTLNQRVAQLAAWNLANGLTWEQLSKIEYRFANGTTAPQYSTEEIQLAMQLTAVVTKTAQEKEAQKKAEEAAAAASGRTSSGSASKSSSSSGY